MLESESSALPFGDSAIYYKKYLIIEARDGIRTRDPRLGKAILHHWATRAHDMYLQNYTQTIFFYIQ